MKLYTFIDDGRERLGAETADGKIVDLDQAQEAQGGARLPAFADMLSLIEAGPDALDIARAIVADPPQAALRARDEVRIAAPLPRPRKIRGFSVFERHLHQATEGAARMMAARESDPEAAYLEKRKAFNLDSLVSPGWYETPAYYYSDCTAVIGHAETVTWPAYSDWIDYELEVVAIIGRRGKDIPREKAAEHIFGYSIFNDLSARDAQFKAMATGLGFAKGKDFDGSNPFGPCIVTADEIPDPYALTLRTRVNGEEWACSTGKDAYWRFDQCIAYASQSQTIHPGELFSTGCTPNCCSMELMRTVRRGDTIELEVEGIGVLRTHIA